ncbi:hypothetical protein T02_12271 [Trichinella nativa]|uniref:Uncharacterized protein n=1 Tax=Trichinella nativa TaxID=6335 RepID=A0A0V1LAV6_9BILA|nr:hypothetical protein T02_12271 [Trichinella nativa]
MAYHCTFDSVPKPSFSVTSRSLEQARSLPPPYYWRGRRYSATGRKNRRRCVTTSFSDITTKTPHTYVRTIHLRSSSPSLLTVASFFFRFVVWRNRVVRLVRVRYTSLCKLTSDNGFVANILVFRAGEVGISEVSRMRVSPMKKRIEIRRSTLKVRMEELERL